MLYSFYPLKSYRHPALRDTSLELWSSLLSFDRVDASITLFSLNRSLSLRRLRRLGDTWCKSTNFICKYGIWSEKSAKKSAKVWKITEKCLSLQRQNVVRGRERFAFRAKFKLDLSD